MRHLLLAALLSMSTLAHANAISLVSGDDYAPYADSKLPEGGMTTDIVRKAFAEMKVSMKVDWLPWKRGFEEAKAGKYGGTFPYLKTVEREQDFLYSDVVVKLQDHAFVKSGNTKIDFNTVGSLTGTTICLPLGWAATPKLAEVIKSGKIKTSSPKDISTCVKMVESGRADYFVSDEVQGAAALKSSGVAAGSVVMSDVVLADNSLYLIASKSLPGSKDLLATFNKGLDAMRKNGSYAKIVKIHSK